MVELPRDADGFQSTPLIRGATGGKGQARYEAQFQSTPLIRGATVRILHALETLNISIHAPHTRGDGRILGLMEVPSGKFQSTPLIRGATVLAHLLLVGLRISIHAPHTRGDLGERQRTFPLSHRVRDFNPRPSYEGRPFETREERDEMVFQSTPLIRGATSSPRA